MNEQMVNYVSRNGVISLFQSGFRLGHSTETAIARVFDDVRLNMESNQPTIFVLLDFSKAFDSVCHGSFILKLRQRYGFVFLSFSSISKSCIYDNSHLAPLVAGVPQESPISPFCFFSVY
jgi:hypothetical protein